MTCITPAIATFAWMWGRSAFRFGLSACVLFVGLGASVASAAEAPPGWPAVAALFVERCVMCHSGEHAAVELHLDSYEGAVKGSKNGPVLLAGDAAASELLRRVRGERQPRMPFLGYPLDADAIALLEQWIEAGLPNETSGNNQAGDLRTGAPEKRTE